MISCFRLDNVVSCCVGTSTEFTPRLNCRRHLDSRPGSPIELFIPDILPSGDSINKEPRICYGTIKFVHCLLVDEITQLTLILNTSAYSPQHTNLIYQYF